ncbi:MAG: hypothetical protein NC417_13395 [Candidatus Gastranaerophilales bacterium]|nr:hypothetical protein [Candidatus Gastranaerophilales bacterium]
MNMNPNILMKLINAKNTFTTNHPKFEAFVRTVFLGEKGIPEGTVIEIAVTRPGEETIAANLRVQRSDLDLVEELRNLGR